MNNENKDPNRYIVLIFGILGLISSYTLVKYFAVKGDFVMDNGLIIIWTTGIIAILTFTYFYFKAIR